MTKIFIDPGHGGRDPGAVANGLQEKDIVLGISLQMRDMLRDYNGVQVRMSRTNDTYVSLSDRAQMANAWGADYFVSIHVNAGGGTGFESFIWNGGVSSATVANRNVMHGAIMNRLSGVTDRGKKQANFAVLRQTAMPAILTENLFIDRASDAAKLRDRNFLSDVARGHAEGVAQIFGLQKKQPVPEPEPEKEEESDMLKLAVVINSFADFPVAELAARRVNAPIYLRATAEGKEVAETVIVIGGGTDGIQAGEVVDLSGSDRFETAQNVAGYLG